MNWKVDEMLTAIGLFLTSFALLKGIIEYQKAQKWKKQEFLAKEVKEFFDDWNVKRMLRLLDWNKIDISLAEGELLSNPEQKSVILIDADLFQAWKHHSEVLQGYEEKEALIRHIFDDGLPKLALFYQYTQSGLISTEDLKPYLTYWIQLIGDKNNGRKSPELWTQLWQYIEQYGYPDIQKLCQAFGYDIRIKK